MHLYWLVQFLRKTITLGWHKLSTRASNWSLGRQLEDDSLDSSDCASNQGAYNLPPYTLIWHYTIIKFVRFATLYSYLALYYYSAHESTYIHKWINYFLGKNVPLRIRSFRYMIKAITCIVVRMPQASWRVIIGTETANPIDLKQKHSALHKTRYVFISFVYPVRWTAQSTLHFTPPPPRQTCSFRHQLDFSGKHAIYSAIRAKTNHSHFHSCLIYTAECTGALWREWKCPNFETVPNGDSIPGSLNCKSGILVPSHRAPEKTVKITHYINKNKCVWLLCATIHLTQLNIP